MEALEKRGEGAWLRVRVQPKASRNSIHVAGDRVRIALTAPPVDGAANEALVAFLAKTLGISRRCVTLVQGEKSRDKVVCITELELGAIEAILRDATGSFALRMPATGVWFLGRRTRKRYGLSSDSSSEAVVRTIVHFDPRLDVEIRSAIELGYTMTISRTSHGQQLKCEDANSVVRLVPYKGQTLGLVDNSCVGARQSAQFANWLDSAPSAREVDAIIACGLAAACDASRCDGDYVVVTDHVNLMGDSPLIGQGVRFADMSDTYPKRFWETAAVVAAEKGCVLRDAVYVACPDSVPCPAWACILDGCVFGPAIVPTALMAARESIPVLGLAIIDSDSRLSDSECGEKSLQYKRFVEFGLECAVRISQNINRVQ